MAICVFTYTGTIPRYRGVNQTHGLSKTWDYLKISNQWPFVFSLMQVPRHAGVNQIQGLSKTWDYLKISKPWPFVFSLIQVPRHPGVNQIQGLFKTLDYLKISRPWPFVFSLKQVPRHRGVTKPRVYQKPWIISKSQRNLTFILFTDFFTKILPGLFMMGLKLYYLENFGKYPVQKFLYVQIYSLTAYFKFVSKAEGRKYVI
jgi:hypothetical protein